MQACGLASAYMERDAVHRYCRRLMSLPSAEIEPAFQRIKSRAQCESLLKLVCSGIVFLLVTLTLSIVIFIYLSLLNIVHVLFSVSCLELPCGRYVRVSSIR